MNDDDDAWVALHHTLHFLRTTYSDVTSNSNASDWMQDAWWSCLCAHWRLGSWRRPQQKENSTTPTRPKLCLFCEGALLGSEKQYCVNCLFIWRSYFAERCTLRGLEGLSAVTKWRCPLSSQGSVLRLTLHKSLFIYYINGKSKKVCHLILAKPLQIDPTNHICFWSASLWEGFRTRKFLKKFHSDKKKLNFWIFPNFWVAIAH